VSLLRCLGLGKLLINFFIIFFFITDKAKASEILRPKFEV